MKFFSQTELKVFFLVIGIGSIIAVTITLLVALISNPSVSTQSRTDAREKAIVSKIDETEILIPEEFRNVWKGELYQYRPQMPQWTDEQVQKYWIDPKTLLLEFYEQRNRSLLEGILEDVP